MKESFIEYFPQKTERKKLEKLYEEIFEKGNTNWEEIIQPKDPHKVEQYIATYLYDWIVYELESAMIDGDYFVIFKTYKMLKKRRMPMKALVFYNNPIEIPKEESFAVIINLSENNLEDFLTKLIPLYEEIHIIAKPNTDISPIIQKAMENKVKVILECQEYKVRVC